MHHLLRHAYNHVQLVLYRPFLHYISSSLPQTSTSTQCYAYAAACVDASRNVIYNLREMEKLNPITGPYWFSIYTTFCAVLALLFYVWENADTQGIEQSLRDAEYGRDVLEKLAHRSVAAARHAETIAVSSDISDDTLAGLTISTENIRSPSRQTWKIQGQGTKNRETPKQSITQPRLVPRRGYTSRPILRSTESRPILTLSDTIRIIQHSRPGPIFFVGIWTSTLATISRATCY